MGFNSTLVQLKEFIYCARGSFATSFNSTLVQLKVLVRQSTLI